MKKLFCIVSILSSLYSYGQINTALADTLARMVVADQQAAGLPPKGLNFASPEFKNFKDSVFTSHKAKLGLLFAQYGYPGYDKVGEPGSHHFWLLVQHLDAWPVFQQKVLDAMEKEVAKKNASPADFAYLTDRVRLNTGKKQLYGTQVTYNLDSCQAIPKPLEDPANVNARRAKMELGFIEIYLNQMSDSHFIMNEEMYRKKGITQPKQYPVQPSY